MPAEVPNHTSTDKAGTPERVSAEANPSPNHTPAEALKNASTEASKRTSEHTSAEAPKRTPVPAKIGP